MDLVDNKLKFNYYRNNLINLLNNKNSKIKLFNLRNLKKKLFILIIYSFLLLPVLSSINVNPSSLSQQQQQLQLQQYNDNSQQYDNNINFTYNEEHNNNNDDDDDDESINSSIFVKKNDVLLAKLVTMVPIISSSVVVALSISSKNLTNSNSYSNNNNNNNYDANELIKLNNSSSINNNFNTANPIAKNEDYLKFFQIVREITGIYLFPLISIFGIVGSIFIAIVYKKSKKCSTNFYLIAMSLSDIVKLLNDLSYFLVNFISKFNGSLGEKLFFIMYSYSHYIFVLTALNTSWLTCAIALDRYIAVVENHGKRRGRNYLQSIVVSLTILIISVLLAIPAPLFHYPIQEFDQERNMTVKKLANTKLGESNFKKIYQYINGMLRAVIPLLVLIFLNYKIIRVVYKNKMKKTKTKNAKSKSRVTLMLITIVLTFTICIFPDAIMTMMQLGYATENYLVRGIREITDLLLAINSASTFPICYYFSIQFRSKFKQLFLRRTLSTNKINNKTHTHQLNTHGNHGSNGSNGCNEADETSRLFSKRKSLNLNLIDMPTTLTAPNNLLTRKNSANN